MTAASPVVLIASVSVYERRGLELALEATGWKLRGVEDAEQAALACGTHGGACVLVVDAGLLETPEDPQWRVLRSRHPQLGAVVRCLVPAGEIRRADRNTFLVHPDDEEGIRRAIGALCAG